MDGMEPPILDETWGLEDIARLHQENGNTSEYKEHSGLFSFKSNNAVVID
jgi:hypothetical protein